MAKRKPSCRLGSDAASMQTSGCVTEGKKTFCVGDRVKRSDVSGYGAGTVIALHAGADNHKRKRQAARVCWDSDEPGDLAYPFLFSELKAVK